MHACSDQTRAEAWLKAARLLQQQDEPIYNLVVEIVEPSAATRQSRAIEQRVDAFLDQHGCQPIHTVAETIFPAVEYRTGGLAKVLEYPNSIFPNIKSVPENRQGTYALRLTQRKCSDGSVMSPLHVLIEKLHRQLKRSGPPRAAYELDLGMEPLELKFYETEDDKNNVRGGQCLSHVSFKLGPERQLYLTALYRYQYFAQKALGNYKGLARLQACIAHEVGIPVGPLVCHATFASLETGPWKHGDLDQLLTDCEQAPATVAEGAA